MSSRPHIAALAGVAAVAIAIAGGCGGDDETTTDAGASGASGVEGVALTEEEFVDQANAICADANDQVEALDQPADVQGLGDYAQEVVEISAPLIGQMDALVPPEEMQADFDAYVQSVRDQSDLAQQLADAAEAGDTQEVQSLAQQLQETDNDPQAQALGLTECAEDPTPES